MNDSIQPDNLTCKSAPFAPLPHSANTIVTFNELNREILRITSEGRLEKGPGLSDDEASLLFFDACQKVFSNAADELRDLRAAVAEEIRANATLEAELLAERAAFAEFRTHAWEQQKDLRAERDKLLGFYTEIVKELGDDLVVKRFREMKVELATQKVQNNHNWQFQEISESALKRAEAAEHDCRVLIGQLNDAEAKLSDIRTAVIEACRNAQMKVLVWYPENTRNYIHPNQLAEIYKSQVTECLAAIERVFGESGRQQEDST